MSTHAADLIVRKSVTVAAPLERAFEVFTERMGAWWPFASHSIHGDEVESLVFEGREGGSLHEVARGGETAPWATVLAWEPPTRVLLSWHVNPQNPATEVEVTFAPEGDGTRVVLEHRGFERLGESGENGRRNYDEGWAFVLGRFADGIG